MKIIIHSMITIIKSKSSEYNQIIKDNRFPNPKLIDAEKMGRSCKNIPQYIYSYEHTSNGISVPVGYLDMLPDGCEITDNRLNCPASIPPLKGITLRSYQKRALEQAKKHGNGLIEHPTASGKTVTGLSIIHHHQQKALIVTHSVALLNQWRNEIKQKMGIESGIIGHGKWDEKNITVGMVQTLAKNINRPLNYGLVLIDEVHRLPSKQFYTVINKLACKYKYGLSATMIRADGMSILINRCLGSIIDKATLEEVQEAGGAAMVTIATVRTGRTYQPENWNDYIKLIEEDEKRNQLIVFLVRKAAAGIPTLILVNHIKHAETLSKMVEIPHTLIHGKLKNKAELMDSITENNLTISTISLLGEGISIARWSALFLVNPVSSALRLNQVVGRIMRNSDNKKASYVIDFVDNCAFSVSSYKKRLAIYQEKKYTLVERDYTRKSNGVA